MGQFHKEFSIVDYGVFIATLLLSLGIGLYQAFVKKQRSNRDYLMGGGHMPLLPVALSLLVSYISAILTLGVPAEVYAHGAMYWNSVFGTTIALSFSAYVFVPTFYNLKLTSVYEYLELRFNSQPVRWLASITFMLNVILYMGVALYAPSIAVSAITNLPEWVSIVCVGLTGTVYTALGGLRAVVWTDVFQATVMFAGLFAIIIQGSIDTGGFLRVFQVAKEHGRLEFWDFSSDIFQRHNTWNLSFGTSLLWMKTYGCHQTQVQRYLSMKNTREAVLAILINIPLLATIVSLGCIAGLTIFSVYENCDPLKLGLIRKKDQIVPFFVMDKLSCVTSLPGLFVACIFSGALSTLSSGLNSLAAITWEDYLKKHQFFNNVSEVKQMTIIKTIGFFYGIIAMGLSFFASNLGGVIQTTISISGAIAGPLLGVFLLGLLFPCTNSKGAFTGMLVGHLITTWVSFGGMLMKNNPPILPTSLEGCEQSLLQNFAVSLANSSLLDGFGNITATPSPLPGWPQRIYNISYTLYPSVGVLVTVIVGLTVSFLTGCSSLEDIDPKLIHPLVRRLCSYKDHWKNSIIKDSRQHNQTSAVETETLYSEKGYKTRKIEAKCTKTTNV